MGSLDNMSNLIDSNWALTKTKIETIESEQNQKVAEIYGTMRENYWTGSRIKEYVDKLVDVET